MKNVIFDLGGVVLEWSPDRILAGYYADPEARTLMKTALFLHPDWLELDRGTLSEADALMRLEDRTSRPSSELTGLFDAVRSSLRPKPDAVALLEKLAGRGVPLYCLSNMASSTYKYLREHHEFWDVFRGVVISGDIKMMKPEPAIFDFLMRRFDLAPVRTAFVDDHPANVDAARTLGLHGVLFKDTPQCEIELEEFLSTM